MVFKHAVRIIDHNAVNPKISENALLLQQDKDKNRKLKALKAAKAKEAAAAAEAELDVAA